MTQPSSWTEVVLTHACSEHPRLSTRPGTVTAHG